ncbi:MAG: gliding motility-associated C-terminal domain-containing protein [Saprospiraceae bacterium]
MKTTSLLSSRVGLCLGFILMVCSTIQSKSLSKSDLHSNDSYLYIIQMMDVTFTTIPAEWCDKETLVLPATSDEGETGIWTPARTINTSGLGGTTITVTFTPTNTAFNQISFDIKIESPPYLGVDQVEPLMFCKTGGDIFVDLVDTLDLQLTNIMTLQGDGQLFSFISENSFNPSEFESELRNLNLKNIPVGPYTFFVESAVLNSCLFQTMSFSLEIIDVQAGVDAELNICQSNQRFHNFNEIIDANPSGTWEEKNGSNSGLSLLSPSSMDLSMTPIGQYFFDYVTQGSGPCAGYRDTATLVVNILSNPEILLTESSVIVCSSTNFSDLTINLSGVAPFDFSVQLIDDQGNLFPPLTINTNQEIYTFQVKNTTGMTRIEDGVIYLNQSSSYYDLVPVAIQDANSGLCFDEVMTGSTRIGFDFLELDINETICEGGSYFFINQLFDKNNPSGSVIKQGLCDTIYNISLTFSPAPVIPITEELCENESVIIKGQSFSANRLSAMVRTATSGGCDTIFDISVTIKEKISSHEVYELCPGQSVMVGNTEYDINNSFGTEVLNATNGCDSVIIVNIIEKPSLFGEVSNKNCEGIIEMVLCEGDTVEVDAELFHINRPSGTVYLSSHEGCDSIIEVNLFYSSPVFSQYKETLCESDVRTIGGIVFDINNPSGMVTLIGANGCDSIIDVNLTYGQSSITDLEETICDGKSFDFGNDIILDANNLSFIANLTTPEGCDSIVNYSVIINPSFSKEINESICEGESITVGPNTFDANNPIGTVTLQTVLGCDSIIDINLDILSPTSLTISESLCGDDAITVGNEIFDKNKPSGQVILTNASGCDSIITIDLNINEIYDFTISETICKGETFNFGNGVTLDENNTSANMLFPSSQGCDSMVTYNVVILPTYENDYQETLCEGETRNFGTQVFDINNQSGIVMLTTTAGCDSIINVNLTINEISRSSIEESFCGLEEITVGTTTFNEANPNGDVVLINALGCDSIVTVDLSFGRTITNSVNASVCEGEDYDFGNDVILNENKTTETKTFTTALGCDSIVDYSLIINSPVEINIEREICKNGFITIGGTTFNAVKNTGTIVDKTVNGCDSIINVTVFEAKEAITYIDTTLCTGESINIAGITYTTNYSGGLLIPNGSRLGCDSMVEVSVKFFQYIPGPSIRQEICKGESVQIGGQTFDENRLRGQVTLNNPNSCDTLVEVFISVAEDNTTTIDDIICKGSSVVINGTIYDADNLAGESMFTGANGCDSTVFVNLVLQEDITGQVNENLCKGSTITINNVEYSESNLTGETILTTTDGCDSTVYVNITLMEDITGQVNATLCEGDFMEIEGRIFDANNTSGEISLITAAGCDSTVFVNIEIAQNYFISIDTTVCASEFGSGINSADVLRDTVIMQTAQGCDSVFVLNMFLLESATSSYSETLCADEFVNIGNETFDINNPFGNATLTSSIGCDSIVTVDLTFITATEETISSILCEGEEINVNDEIYDIDRPTGQEIIRLSNGCDSIIIIDLSFKTSSTTIFNNKLCKEESIVVNGITYDIDTPRGRQVLPAGNGCDSILEIELSFSVPEDYVINDHFCAGEELIIEGTTFDINNPSGTVVIQNALGCDSMVIVTLSFTEINVSARGLSVCPEDPTGGKIMIENITDGMGPYTYALNGQSVEIIHEYPTEISNLSPGQYDLEIVDSEGCSTTRKVTISESQGIEVGLEWIKVDEGVYDLILNHRGTIDSLHWESLADLSCVDCIQPQVILEETSAIKVIVFDESGCRKEAEIILEYQKSIQAVIANIISTRSTLGNDMLYLTLDNAENISYDLLIFNRWGEIVHRENGLTPNDPNMGWNGTRAGRKLDAGVYIYEMMVKENNVLVEVFHGDVTLID